MKTFGIHDDKDITLSNLIEIRSHEVQKPSFLVSVGRSNGSHPNGLSVHNPEWNGEFKVND